MRFAKEMLNIVEHPNSSITPGMAPEVPQVPSGQAAGRRGRFQVEKGGFGDAKGAENVGKSWWILDFEQLNLRKIWWKKRMVQQKQLIFKRGFVGV